MRRRDFLKSVLGAVAAVCVPVATGLGEPWDSLEYDPNACLYTAVPVDVGPDARDRVYRRMNEMIREDLDRDFRQMLYANGRSLKRP